jgi:hypothetical protein
VAWDEPQVSVGGFLERHFGSFLGSVPKGIRKEKDNDKMDQSAR